jgi:capsular exopolysaccharide synthesis family protein
MSRIHEALKRAEKDRAASQAAPNSEGKGDHSVGSSVIETAPPSPVLPQIPSAHAEAETGLAGLQFETLWSKCARADWKPNPNAIVFENADPFFPGAEQFRTLRSRLYRMRESQPLQTILISSAIPAEGKTLVSTNLAYALVRQKGCRVLLIDADLRSPRVHTVLGAPANPGLADYLQKSATEFEITQRSREDGLCLIPAGTHVTHPSELISSDRMKDFLDGMRTAFDWIIIDSPPALPVADASVLGGMADGVLFVVRANSTPSEASQKACKELRDAHIIGVVLNTAEETSEYNSYYSSSAYTGLPTGTKKK